MMSVHDAEPGDIYADEQGKLWRITSICREPTVTAEEVEPHGHSTDRTTLVGVGIGPVAGGGLAMLPINGTYLRSRQSGGTGGAMWKGWNRIWRKS